jgi:hypothetical protein
MKGSVNSMKRLFIVGILSFSLQASGSYNTEVLDTVREMPQGGGYSTRRDAFDELRRRIQLFDGTIRVDHQSRGTSFCSSATYFVILKTLEKLHHRGVARIQSTAAPLLLPTEANGEFLQDGFGVFGRWNANGPGTAGLFHDLKMGDNFSDDGFYEAKPGDFLKIFWRWGRGVGKFERGHSVVFTKVLPEGATGSNVAEVCFWSSHGYEDGRESGFGEKCVPRADVQEMIFSRLTHPERINRVLHRSYQHENKYLSSLLDVESTIEEARRKTGTRQVRPRSDTLH